MGSLRLRPLCRMTRQRSRACGAKVGLARRMGWTRSSCTPRGRQWERRSAGRLPASRGSRSCPAVPVRRADRGGAPGRRGGCRFPEGPALRLAPATAELEPPVWTARLLKRSRRRVLGQSDHHHQAGILDQTGGTVGGRDEHAVERNDPLERRREVLAAHRAPKGFEIVQRRAAEPGVEEDEHPQDRHGQHTQYGPALLGPRRMAPDQAFTGSFFFVSV